MRKSNSRQDKLLGFVICIKMTKYEIIEKIAKERRIEQMIAYICHSSAPEMADFAQMLYLALLEKPDNEIETAYNEGWLGFKIVRMLKNQYFSKHSPFRDTFYKYQHRVTDLEKAMNEAEEDYWSKPRPASGGE